jgi:hypothetical protein
MIRSIVCLVAAFAVGILLSYVLWGGAAGRPAPQPARLASAPSVQKSAIETARPAGATAASGSPPIHAAMVDAVPIPGELTTSGTISGSVTTEIGAPVPDVVIRASVVSAQACLDSIRGEEGSSEGDPTGTIVRRVSAERLAERLRREAVTSADGAFKLTEVAECSYMLAAAREGFFFEAVDSPVARPGESVKFRAKPVREVSVSIVFPDGTQPLDAEITAANVETAMKADSIYSPTGSILIKWSPAKPMIGISDGEWRLEASVGHGEKYHSGPIVVELRPLEPPPAVVLHLERTLAIRGKLIIPAGEPLRSGMRVWCVAVPPGHAAGVDLFLHEETDVERVSSEGFSPEFTFTITEQGTYLIGAGLTEKSIEVAEKVVAADRDVMQDLVLPPLPSDDFLVVRAYDPRGNPLSDVTVEVDGQDRRRDFTQAPRVDGSFRFLISEVLPSKKAPREAGGYKIRAKSPIYGLREIEWTPAGPRDVAVRFAEPAVLHLTFEGYTPGRRADGSSVDISVDIADTPWDLGSDGTVLAGPFQPGPCIVSLSFHPQLEFPLVLSSGDNRVTLPFPGLHSVTILVPDIEPDAVMGIVPADPAARSEDESEEGSTISEQFAVGADCRVTFSDLPAGDYRIALRPHGEGEMRISVPAGGPIRFSPLPYNALFVGAAYDRLIAGDLIIGANGVRFSRYVDIERLTWLARTQRTANVLVLRNGAEMTVTVDLGELAVYMASGEITYPVHR